jgi:UDP-2,3-diacylglucosamine hydrolase
MPSKTFLIVSDIHLGAVPAATEKAFRAFLDHAGESASGLLINGDLFDFWFEYRTVVPSQHFRVLAQLAELVESGVPVWFVGGNHDAWGGRFLEEQVGVRIINGPAELQIGGRRALVAHGDGLLKGDRGYKALRWVLRNRATVFAFRQLHPDWGSRIASFVSTTEDKANKDPQVAAAHAALVRAWGVERLQADPALDLVVTGHVHMPAVVEVGEGRYYVNSGDWIHHFTYVSVPATGHAPTLERWGPGHGTG